MSDTATSGKTLTVKQAARQVGVHKNTIYALVQAGLLRAYRVGVGRGTIRIVADDLSLVMRFNDQPDLRSLREVRT